MTTSPVRRSMLICGILCLVYALLAGSAVVQKSATYDEPLHVAIGWLNTWRGEYRLSPDQPPLWEYWIALPLGQDALNFDATPNSEGLDHRAMAALYRVPPARGVDLVNRARWMSLPLAVALAALVAVWAGQIGGPAAAVVAMFVFGFDPNWLGHGMLAKNDVAFALVFFAAAYAVWRVGKRATVSAIIAVLVLPAICMGVKFSGLIVGPVLALCLLCRAMMRESGISTRRRDRWLIVASLCIGMACVAYAGLWAQYRFRFDAGFNMPALVRELRDVEVSSVNRTNHPTPAQLAEWRADFSTRAALWLERHRIVPQAWAGGYIYFQSHDAMDRNAYLLGEVYPGGRWDYFLLAWLFKEPLALIAATILTAWIGIKSIRRLSWSLLALGIPAVVYLAMAMHGQLNIGFRHIFPVMPFVDVGIGLAAARAWSHGRFLARSAIVMLAAGLVIESLASYPDFISFFNIACGGERGGLALLGDSNLDWGQDLPLLAEWQKNNPSVPLYLDYFGTCDPATYGIRYVNVPGGYVYGPPPRRPMSPGVAAISATKLQRLFVIDPANDFATPFERAKPIQVLGGTIYLYNYPP